MQQGSETSINQLGQQLGRLRRRAARHKRTIAVSPDAWQRCSNTMQKVEALTSQIVASPALDLHSLSIKFRAILWLIEANDSLLDRRDLQWLRRFGRDLKVVANSSARRGR